MKRETRLLLFVILVTLSILGGLLLLLALPISVVLVPAGKSIALAEAPFVVKVLVGLAALVSGGLLLAPLFQTELTTLRKEKSC
jgi:hypothetical protein